MLHFHRIIQKKIKYSKSTLHIKLLFPHPTTNKQINKLHLRESSKKQNSIGQRLGPWQCDGTREVFDGFQHDLRRRWRLLCGGDRCRNLKHAGISLPHIKISHKASIFMHRDARFWGPPKAWPQWNRIRRFGFVGIGRMTENLSALSKIVHSAHLGHFDFPWSCELCRPLQFGLWNLSLSLKWEVFCVCDNDNNVCNEGFCEKWFWPYELWGGWWCERLLDWVSHIKGFLVAN